MLVRNLRKRELKLDGLLETLQLPHSTPCDQDSKGSKIQWDSERLEHSLPRKARLPERSHHPLECLRVRPLQLCHGEERLRVHEESEGFDKAVSNDPRTQDRLQAISIGVKGNPYLQNNDRHLWKVLHWIWWHLLKETEERANPISNKIL